MACPDSLFYTLLPKEQITGPIRSMPSMHLDRRHTKTMNCRRTPDFAIAPAGPTDNTILVMETERTKVTMGTYESDDDDTIPYYTSTPDETGGDDGDDDRDVPAKVRRPAERTTKVVTRELVTKLTLKFPFCQAPDQLEVVVDLPGTRQIHQFVTTDPEHLVSLFTFTVFPTTLLNEKHEEISTKAAIKKLCAKASAELDHLLQEKVNPYQLKVKTERLRALKDSYNGYKAQEIERTTEYWKDTNYCYGASVNSMVDWVRSAIQHKVYTAYLNSLTPSADLTIIDEDQYFEQNPYAIKLADFVQTKLGPGVLEKFQKYLDDETKKWPNYPSGAQMVLVAFFRPPPAPIDITTIVVTPVKRQRDVNPDGEESEHVDFD